MNSVFGELRNKSSASMIRHKSHLASFFMRKSSHHSVFKQFICLFAILNVTFYKMTNVIHKTGCILLWHSWTVPKWERILYTYFYNMYRFINMHFKKKKIEIFILSSIFCHISFFLNVSTGIFSSLLEYFSTLWNHRFCPLCWKEKEANKSIDPLGT